MLPLSFSRCPILIVPGPKPRPRRVACKRGAIRWAKLNVFEKFIMKMITKKAEDSSSIDSAALAAFTETVAEAARK